eukprot:02388.XXX_58244_58363_1 [CDS] Oithona nana genome sequencing.
MKSSMKFSMIDITHSFKCFEITDVAIQMSSPGISVSSVL